MQRGTTGPYMVYLLADQRAGPYVVGVGGLLAEVRHEVGENHDRRCRAAGDRHLPPLCLVWCERIEAHSAARAQPK